eukprot:NODE_5896_length_628_cov_22.276339_g5498_i0.p1 GENE.NODE_5896_length_628_cov_22.276339_g5498_i0~~NODE_5896_length_628_cov_22.276339_g5498_i0.p1  ORF type:complete len:139 (+),score=29.78 NODE_5896_length_628_cov_22.276339_g5498_i0:61-417(+)
MEDNIRRLIEENSRLKADLMRRKSDMALQAALKSTEGPLIRSESVAATGGAVQLMPAEKELGSHAIRVAGRHIEMDSNQLRRMQPARPQRGFAAEDNRRGKRRSSSAKDRTSRLRELA